MDCWLISIVASPLTGIRKTLGECLLEGSIDENLVNTLVTELRKNLKGSDLALFDKEKDKILEAIKDGKINGEPNLKTQELQLLWGAYLTLLSSSNKRIQDLSLWQQLSGSN